MTPQRLFFVAIMSSLGACADPTSNVASDAPIGRPLFRPGDNIGPVSVPRGDRNDVVIPWTVTSIELQSGLPYQIIASGMLTFDDNASYHTHIGCTSHPTIPGTVGPAGFDLGNRPWAVRAGLGTATTAPSSTFGWKPPLTAGASQIFSFQKGPGRVWVSRPAVLPYACAGPGFDEPAWNVSGSQEIKAVELPLPQVVPDKLQVPSGDTVLFTLQVSWSSSFFIGSGLGWRWVSDTTTSNSTLVNNCPRTLNTCRVVVREKGHVEVQNVQVENMSFDARSPIVVIGSTPCDPEVQVMIGEYVTYLVNLQPTCPDFTNTGGTTNFSWNALNGGFAQGNPHNPWGMVKVKLTNGLEATYTNYNNGAITLTSGYRCPHGNYSVGGAAFSYHMHGRAADMKSAEHAWTEQEFNLLKAAADSTSPAPIESLNWNTYADHHYHVAW